MAPGIGASAVATMAAVHKALPMRSKQRPRPLLRLSLTVTFGAFGAAGYGAGSTNGALAGHGHGRCWCWCWCWIKISGPPIPGPRYPAALYPALSLLHHLPKPAKGLGPLAVALSRTRRALEPPQPALCCVSASASSDRRRH